MKTRLLFLFAILIAAFALSGCGGGGGSTGAPAAQSSQVFITDDLNAGFDHVWVNVKKVVLESPTGTTATIYNDPTGATLDLRSLSGKFAFLGSLSVPDGSWSKIHLFMDANLTIIPSGGNAGLQRKFAGFNPANGQKELIYNLSVAKTLAAAKIVVDFDLSQWTDDGTLVTAVVKEGDQTGTDDPTKQLPGEFFGTVSGLAGTAPNLTFTLTSPAGTTVKVVTDANTGVYNSNGSPNPTIANSVKLAVIGKFDTVQNAIVASIVRIRVDADANLSSIRGVAKNVDPVTGAFDILVEHCEGFLPPGALIHVTTTDTTKFFGGEGRNIGFTDFFAALPTADEAQVQGSYDSNTNTLSAVRARVEIHSDLEEAAARGPAVVSSIDAVNSKFDLTVNKVDGIFLPLVPAPVIHVEFADSPVYLDQNLQVITHDQFFPGLATAASVTVEGNWNGDTQTLTAKKAKLNSADGLGSYVEVEGAASTSSADLGTFTVLAIQWENLLISNGTSVNIATDGSTVFRGTDSTVITKDAFFAGLTGSTVAHVEGTLKVDGTTVLAKVARLKPHE